MKTLLAITLFAALLLAVAHTATAQTPTREDGPVWRMIYLRIKPGQESAFWKDMHETARPVFELGKKEGVFVDYKFLVNPAKSSPDEWDVMMGLALPNYAMLDQLEAKAAALYLKHFGSAEAAAASQKKRDEYREVLAIRLMREVKLK